MDSSLIIILIIIGIFLIPSLRSGKAVVATRPKRIISFTTPRSVVEVLDIVKEFAVQNNYKLEDVDPTLGRIILSDSPTRNSWGFFYPIYISNQNDGNTLVEVGIKSKMVQVGKIVGSSHDKCAEGIKRVLE